VDSRSRRQGHMPACLRNGWEQSRPDPAYRRRKPPPVLHVPVTRLGDFRQHWSDWRRYRQASAPQVPLSPSTQRKPGAAGVLEVRSSAMRLVQHQPVVSRPLWSAGEELTGKSTMRLLPPDVMTWAFHCGPQAWDPRHIVPRRAHQVGVAQTVGPVRGAQGDAANPCRPGCRYPVR
jgi:hypothetical protein